MSLKEKFERANLLVIWKTLEEIVESIPWGKIRSWKIADDTMPVSKENLYDYVEIAFKMERGIFVKEHRLHEAIYALVDAEWAKHIDPKVTEQERQDSFKIIPVSELGG